MTEATKTTEGTAPAADAATRESAKFHIFAKDGNYHVVDGKREAGKLVGDLGTSNVNLVIKGHKLEFGKREIVSFE